MKHMNGLVVFLYVIGFCNAVLGQEHDQATSKDAPSKTVKVTLKYLSLEAINNFYLDDEGVKHPVHDTRVEAVEYLRHLVASRPDSFAAETFTLPKTMYIWKAIDDYQDEEKHEIIYYDESRDIIYDKPPEK